MGDAARERQRAAIAEELATLGRRRRRLRTTLENLDLELRPIVARAVAAGLPYRRIRELTGLGQTTIREWSRET